MVALVAIGAGILLGFLATERAMPVYWRLLGAQALPRGRLTRLWLRAQRALLGRAGHHPYLLACLEALEQAPDPSAAAAARARLRWWCAVRRACRV